MFVRTGWWREGRKAGKENFIEINVKEGLVGCTIIR